MNPWLFPWWGFLKGPLSGDVTQDIAPVTSWLSPQLEFNFSGNRRIEAEVVADVASYGKQLGILTDAMLELTDGKPGEGVAKLKELAERVEQVKLQHSGKLEQQMRAKLNELKLQDPKALERLLNEYRNP